jgi:hypothetical protein
VVLAAEIPAKGVDQGREACEKLRIIDGIRLKEMRIGQRRGRSGRKNRRRVDSACPMIQSMAPSAKNRLQGLQLNFHQVGNCL